jgi:hypothetical protein
MSHVLDKRSWIVNYLSRLYRWMYSWDIWWLYGGFYFLIKNRNENTVLLTEGTILVLDRMAEDKHTVRCHNRSLFGMWNSHLWYINGCNRPAMLHVLYALGNPERNRRIENSQLPYSCAVSLRKHLSTFWGHNDLWWRRWMFTNQHSWTSRKTEVFISFLLIRWFANVRAV